MEANRTDGSRLTSLGVTPEQDGLRQGVGDHPPRRPLGPSPAAGSEPEVSSELDRQRQHGRLLEAATEAVAERGYRAIGVADVLAGAGLPKPVFDEHFDDLRGCVLAAHDLALDRLVARLVRACANQDGSAEKLAAAVAALVDFSLRSPAEARLLMLDAVAVDPVLAARVLGANEILAGLLRSRRADLCQEIDSLPDLTEALLVGAITSLVGVKLMAGDADGLAELETELVELALTPYFGLERARRVALDRSAQTA